MDELSELIERAVEKALERALVKALHGLLQREEEPPPRPTNFQDLRAMIASADEEQLEVIETEEKASPSGGRRPILDAIEVRRLNLRAMAMSHGE